MPARSAHSGVGATPRRVEEEDVARAGVRCADEPMRRAQVPPERSGAAVGAEAKAGVMERPLDEGGPLVGGPSLVRPAPSQGRRTLRLEAGRLEDRRRRATCVGAGRRAAERAEAKDDDQRQEDLEPTKSALAGQRQGHAPIV